jgi:hypothetical protein
MTAILIAATVALLLFGGFVYFLFDFLQKVLWYLDFICWLVDGKPEEHEH